MAEAATNPYDEVAYPGFPYPQTHPDRLAVIATLFGMRPAPADDCRVLELGCCDGSNLIPMAFGLPGSAFVGIDLAARAVEKGQALVEALGLKNVHLRRLDLMDIPADLGAFDYIIAHGVYSWVPPAVRDRVLALCGAHLKPHGVAYVSYNTYPGWRIREMFREMMLFHTRHIQDPPARIGQARALLKFLGETEAVPNVYRTSLKDEVDRMMEREGGLLYHDELEEVNAPVYFHQFIEHAGRHGLQYLAEANFHEMQARIFEPPIAEALRQMEADPVARGQYLDFLTCRKFRQTLLCREDVSLNRAPGPVQMAAFHTVSPMRPASPAPDIPSGATEEFRSAGFSVSSNRPPVKAMLALLAEAWPRPLSFEALVSGVRSRLGQDAGPVRSDPDPTEGDLKGILLDSYASGAVDLHLHPPRFAVEVSERPVASPLARLQLREQTTVTTLRHRSIRVEGSLERRLLMLLDGTQDRLSLLKGLTALLASGEVVLRQDNQPVEDAQRASRILNDELGQALAKVARLALLVA